ncbi:TetR/AcrR family transcriptional regulator [Streptomyces sp. DSM 44917]|uniref:TetR/AcrR family transcriptional regulator n=1 Tax=Streptomyces boetiae TaxID=3075541 RepID=A0ABU2L8V7_9ACTN|nr:TetR/AcrR family transcriptional regulator [Streptomyces sp. DSM 44917]MDT0307994.1 TetR/AcrR family transcriptional regulator [Streptomyces sp. DSM 44917]
MRARLLDAAEELFAERGYHGAGIRDITQLAGTRVAAVSDYFGGKENLFREVLLRRLDPINEDRRARLAALPRSGSRAHRLRALVRAFAGPLLVRSGESEGWRNYLRFTAQLAHARLPVQLLVAEEFNAIAAEFIERLRALFPAASEAALHDAYLLMVASTLQTFADVPRIDSITQGRLRSDAFAQRYASLVPFVEGGITRLATDPGQAGGTP